MVVKYSIGYIKKYLAVLEKCALNLMGQYINGIM